MLYAVMNGLPQSSGPCGQRIILKDSRAFMSAAWEVVLQRCRQGDMTCGADRWRYDIL